MKLEKENVRLKQICFKSQDATPHETNYNVKTQQKNSMEEKTDEITEERDKGDYQPPSFD